MHLTFRVDAIITAFMVLRRCQWQMPVTKSGGRHWWVLINNSSFDVPALWDAPADRTSKNLRIFALFPCVCWNNSASFSIHLLNASLKQDFPWLNSLPPWLQYQSTGQAGWKSENLINSFEGILKKESHKSLS